MVRSSTQGRFTLHLHNHLREVVEKVTGFNPAEAGIPLEQLREHITGRFPGRVFFTVTGETLVSVMRSTPAVFGVD